uniref:Uncharacterized protein n=1 Tax=Candidatus Kentrum sp. TC TaxID=2126339 RepID=A0A450YYD1_9GAMM|nr:MAG: hypothetical protein BECKTC1821E_GA0114239_103226 [Candidatus Kentron sp. TC]VFK46560.1 MAG: hypothetical protein BECKTC1821D_GA0114238_10337 [Candidatus Kentron sp. TC]
MGRTRCGTTVLPAGAAGIRSTRFLQVWLPKRASPSRRKSMRYVLKPIERQPACLKKGHSPRYRTHTIKEDSTPGFAVCDGVRTPSGYTFLRRTDERLQENPIVARGFPVLRLFFRRIAAMTPIGSAKPRAVRESSPPGRTAESIFLTIKRFTNIATKSKACSPISRRLASYHRSL